MTKSEKRKARKVAHTLGLPLTGLIALPKGGGQTQRNKRRALRRKALKAKRG